MKDTMFHIDLLKGQALPVKSRPVGIAIGVIGFWVPLLAFMLIAGWYLRNEVVISVQARQLESYESQIETWSAGFSRHKELMDEKRTARECLDEVATTVSRYSIQWSGIIEEVVRQMPESIVLTGLEVDQRGKRVSIPHKNNPSREVEINIPIRTLRIELYSSTSEQSDADVKDFRDRMMSSPIIGPRVENIRVSQEVDVVDDGRVSIYQMDCIFKSPI